MSVSWLVSSVDALVDGAGSVSKYFERVPKFRKLRRVLARARGRVRWSLLSRLSPIASGVTCPLSSNGSESFV